MDYEMRRREDGKWEVKSAGGRRVLHIFPTRQEAWTRFRDLAGNSGGDVFLCKTNGSAEKHLTPSPGLELVSYCSKCSQPMRLHVPLAHSTKPDLSNRELRSHFDRRFDTIGRQFAELEEENVSLKQELAQTIANIATQVDPEYFRWIYTVLASGSVSKASKALKMPNSTFDKRLREFACRGGLYATLYSLIKIRKGCGLKSIERYNPDYVVHQQAGSTQTVPAIRDLLDGLEALRADNWELVRTELIELVMEELV